MDDTDRQKCLQIITRKLVYFTGGCLAAALTFFYIIVPLFGDTLDRTYLVALVFLLGLIGGFVSIQQRLPTIELKELRELSGSWSSVVLIPINGGIFSLVLMLMFLSEVLVGPMFPEFKHQPIDSDNAVKSILSWFSNTVPKSGPDIAKLLFWSFVAGFSERFVPQIIRKTKGKSEEG